MSNEVYIDPDKLAEEIVWLKDYQALVGNDRFLEFVASRAIYLSSKCKEYRPQFKVEPHEHTEQI